jgi:hypothetical protein
MKGSTTRLSARPSQTWAPDEGETSWIGSASSSSAARISSTGGWSPASRLT